MGVFRGYSLSPILLQSNSSFLLSASLLTLDARESEETGGELFLIGFHSVLLMKGRAKRKEKKKEEKKKKKNKAPRKEGGREVAVLEGAGRREEGGG